MLTFAPCSEGNRDKRGRVCYNDCGSESAASKRALRDTPKTSSAQARDWRTSSEPTRRNRGREMGTRSLGEPNVANGVAVSASRTWGFENVHCSASLQESGRGLES